MTDPTTIEALLALKAARQLIVSKYRDPDAEVDGEWLAKEARPVHAQICEAFAALARPSPQTSDAISDRQLAAGLDAMDDEAAPEDNVTAIYRAMSALAEPRVPSDADVVTNRPDSAMTPKQEAMREAVARIISPDLWGSPWAYPDGIESAYALEFHRNRARDKAVAAIAAMHSVSTLDMDEVIDAAVKHCRRYSTPKADDPRRQYTLAQVEIAIRKALNRISGGGQ